MYGDAKRSIGRPSTGTPIAGWPTTIWPACWSQTGGTTKPSTIFDERSHRDPIFAESYYNLAVVLARRGQTDEAIANFRRALDVKPDLPEAHADLALL